MMTREQINEIVDYSQEHDVTIKQRLQELNIPESNFYYAKLILEMPLAELKAKTTFKGLTPMTDAASYRL
ncbi:MAG: hypothetical protein II171_06350 [Bacteroidales bacterium]|nr:hypothetical protein [Bacteroidales bacterium]MBQ1913162.1 hypothetical protein [Bacteroidales bacterium]